MFCHKCGRELPEDAVFCPACGNRVAPPVQPTVEPVKPVAQPVRPVVQPVQPVVLPIIEPIQPDPPHPDEQGPVKCGPFYFPRNPAAIWSYYLGFATLIFCFITGIPALITGICGLVHAHHHPEGRGTGHSVFGIVMGSLSIVFGLIWLVVVELEML